MDLGNPNFLQVVVDVMLAMVTGGLGLYLWLSKKSAINANHITRLEQDITTQLRSQSDRLTRLEEALDRTDLSKINGRITANTQEVARLRGEFAGVKSTLDLIHQFFLRQRESGG